MSANDDIVKAFGGDRPSVIDWDRIDAMTDEGIDELTRILGAL